MQATPDHKEVITDLQKIVDSARKDRNTPLTVTEIQDVVINFLEKIRKKNPNAAVGYVAGSITADGPKHIQKNIEKLSQYATHLREKFGPYIFSTKEIFADKEQTDITAQGESAQVEMRSFWRNILKSGVITDLFMIPGWQRSTGAKDEHNTADSLHIIRLHYVEPIDLNA